MRINYFVVPLFTLAAVMADPTEKQLAADIDAILCDLKAHTPEWYSCVSCCQGKLPYETHGNKNPYAETRDVLYKDPAFNQNTQDQECKERDAFVEQLKVNMLDLKSDLKAAYSTAAGMQTFFEKKYECFLGCNKTPIDTAACTGF
ncbi:hypothetical protein EMPS_05735 [Entomortierella parvispora]|uniref:Uncharacterized protein n=1 Tax=Entomortierella parvispora TaxID=205924 RepID=A0A9P3HB20_9FUNG|nr:hypothetical protein EMPS_05735 [Entomortierella parvispora]